MSFTLQEVHRLRVLRKIFWSKIEEVTGNWRKPQMRSFKICTAYQNIVHVFRPGRMIWVGHVAHVQQKWWGNLTDREYM